MMNAHQRRKLRRLTDRCDWQFEQSELGKKLRAHADLTGRLLVQAVFGQRSTGTQGH